MMPEQREARTANQRVDAAEQRRRAIETVVRHLAAVRLLDTEAMAADYAEDAVLVRGEDRYVGRTEIARYFASVPERLAGGRVETRISRATSEVVEVAWRVRGGQGDGVSGTDRFAVALDRIVHQQVRVEGEDF